MLTLYTIAYFLHEHINLYVTHHCMQSFSRNPYLINWNKNMIKHDDVIKWRHFPCDCPFFARNSRVIGEFPSQKLEARSFDVFFAIRLNTRLSKQSWGWRFEKPSRSLWRHRNDHFKQLQRRSTKTKTCLWKNSDVSSKETVSSIDENGTARQISKINIKQVTMNLNLSQFDIDCAKPSAGCFFRTYIWTMSLISYFKYGNTNVVNIYRDLLSENIHNKMSLLPWGDDISWYAIVCRNHVDCRRAASYISCHLNT